MRLSISHQRLVLHGNMLWDDLVPWSLLRPTDEPLSTTDEDVRQDIEALLIRHEQREMPPLKPKKAKTKTAKKEKPSE